VTTPSWRDRLRDIAGDIRSELHHVADAAGVGGPPQPHEIVAYRSYGDGRRMLVHGRALESKNIPPSTADDSPWRNLINTYKRIESDPLPNARLRVHIGRLEREIVADREGFFREWLELPAPLPAQDPWHRAELRLVAPLRPEQPDVRTNALIRVPSTSSTFGVISDLDDTVIQSRVANFLQAARTVMLGNARTRLPFPGVAAFYQALERGGDGTRQNPIFYVSSSPWNVYDIIAEFMRLQRIPVGPICLRDWDLHPSFLTAGRLHSYKEPLIAEILELYPALPFLLIGDSSQKDPEIYRAIIDRYPGRILGVYIRDVHPDPARRAAVAALANDTATTGASLVLASDSYTAAAHAAAQGWITTESLSAIEREKEADESESPTKPESPSP
jgi:phosphatidate phosphatase APP1